MFSTNLAKRPPRQESAKGWFLTYPKCDLTKEQLLKALQAQDPPIQEWVVAREFHEDGSPHLHAFIKYGTRVSFSPYRWDVFHGDQRFHGNYQVARSWTQVQKYCQKEGDFIASFDTAAATSKRAARNRTLMTGNLKDLVDSGFIAAERLKIVQANKNAYLQLTPLENRPDVCGIWVYGAPGVGKSHLVRDREPSLYQKAQNKWWDGYVGQEAVLLDDLDAQGSCLFHYMKIWADKWGTWGEVKGDTVPLNYKRFYVTSNFKIEEIFKDQPQETIKAIRRRFHVIKLVRNHRARERQDIEEVIIRGPLDN